MIRRKCRIPECQDEIGTMQLHHYRCGQVIANAHVVRMDSGYTRKRSLLIESRGHSQKTGIRGDYRGGHSFQGPPAGHDLFRCPSVVNPVRSGMRNRSMSVTTRFRGTASM
jgi:hypothetical protein